MIQVTDTAIAKAVAKLSHKGSEALLLGLKPSGCLGYSYVLEYCSDRHSWSHTRFEFENLIVYIDHKSLPLLDGMTLDYAYEGLNEGFKFVNPNLSTECGCGESVNA